MPAGTGRDTARLMLQTMLATRFSLKFHFDQKDVPVYALVAAKGGFKLSEVEDTHRSMSRSEPGHYSVDQTSMGSLALHLSLAAGRPVLDLTGLKGVYKIDLRWAPADDESAWNGRDPGILGALDQAGLHLESQKKPYQILIIDHIDRTPTAN